MSDDGWKEFDSDVNRCWVKGKWLRILLLLSSFAVCLYLIVCEIGSRFQSPRILFLLSLAAFAAASWWHKDAKRVAEQRKPHTACWRNAVFLLCLVIGGYCISLASYTKLVQHGYLLKNPATTIAVPVVSVIVEDTKNTSAVSPSGHAVEETKPSPIEFLSLFGFIIAVVTSYYLVVLQGVKNEAKELLLELRKKQTELNVLKEEVRSLDQVSLGVFRSIGQFVHYFAVVMQEVAPKDSQEQLSENIAVLMTLLTLHESLRSRPFISLSTLCRTLEELLIQLETKSFIGGGYVPLSLLKEIKEQLEREIQTMHLDVENRTEISDALRTIKKLEGGLAKFN